MSELKPQYALAKLLWDKQPRCPCPSDIAMDNQGKYHQLLQTSSTPHWLVAKEIQDFSVVKVQKILGAGDGEVQWKILNS